MEVETKVNKLQQLDEYLATQRTEWTSKIRGVADDLKHGNNLPEVSSYALSYRQILVDMIASISSKIRTQKSKIRNITQNGSDVRTSKCLSSMVLNFDF